MIDFVDLHVHFSRILGLCQSADTNIHLTALAVFTFALDTRTQKSTSDSCLGECEKSGQNGNGGRQSTRLIAATARPSRVFRAHPSARASLWLVCWARQFFVQKAVVAKFGRAMPTSTHQSAMVQMRPIMARIGSASGASSTGATIGSVRTVGNLRVPGNRTTHW